MLQHRYAEGMLGIARSASRSTSAPCSSRQKLRLSAGRAAHRFVQQSFMFWRE